jgi:hypothetical protein
MPSSQEAEAVKADTEVAQILDSGNNVQDSLHLLAQQWLDAGKTDGAVKILVLADAY